MPSMGEYNNNKQVCGCVIMDLGWGGGGGGESVPSLL